MVMGCHAAAALLNSCSLSLSLSLGFLGFLAFLDHIKSELDYKI